MKMSQFVKTKALYLDNDGGVVTAFIVSCTPFTAASEAHKPLFKTATGNDFLVATDQTLFYAQGGGQPADTGTMTSMITGDAAKFHVTGVRKTTEGTILHLGSFEDSPFEKGDLVTQHIDMDKRRLHSQIHDAGHIISSAVRKLADAIPDVTELKAQHYPDSAFVEFKGFIDGKHKADIEAAANALIDENLPIKVCYWTQEELVRACWSVPETLVLPEGELARAVDIEGAGAYACGGTHMATTGEVGHVRIRNIKRQKGISKISYELA
ncbi:hypothetical protein VD0002_g9100 [Verticillium dahliae]|nr:Threonyl/alanyl tRNA synthetase [Verticillium dahliae]PNH58422.1 hypothetical protein VD0002_g9100 [Verticillium dahliae]RBQ65684.1 hypothetical protein VDGD_10391 [Verticillium dahliae]RXG45154.1 hypothetical protein VDGE_10391 [Verticillium dahliae]